MGRPIPEYVPGPIADIILANWGDAGLRGLADHAGLEYRTLLSSLKRTSNRSLFKFQSLCRALSITMEEGARILQLREPVRRAKLLGLIREHHGSVQDLYRTVGVTDTYVENLFRGDTGERIYTFYVPLAKALGLNLEGLAIALGHTQERLGYRRRA